ncbi:MAG: nucleotide exchange factor GrpE [Kiritimatiellia bacterium]
MEDDQKNTEESAAATEPAAESATETAAEPEAPAGGDTAAEAESAAPQEEPTEAKPAEEEKPAEPDWKDRYARAMADFDNFRKRTARDRAELIKSAAGDVIKDLLKTVDDLARALEGAKEKEDDPFVKGVKLVYDGFMKTLADHGATPLDSVGEPFNADYHEALAQMPSPDVEEGKIMNEVTRGWLLNGKLLRAAKVVVSAGKGA